MKVLAGKFLAIGGICALLGTLGGGAFAQDRMGRDPMHGDRMGGGRLSRARTSQLRWELDVLHKVYDHEIKSGHPESAMKAHLKAEKIRDILHERHHRTGF